MRRQKKLLVFIVEDNMTFAECIKYTVEKRGYDTEVFYSGEDCLDNLYKKPDVITLDYNLGTMTGIEVLKQVKALYPNIPVIFLSDQQDTQIWEESFALGVSTYVVKEGLSFGNLIKALHKISSARSQRDALAWKRKLRTRALACAMILSSLFLLVIMNY